MAISFFWHRRDLRVEDNCGLFHALKESQYVQPVFIFDTEILEKLKKPYDRRVEFIHNELIRLKSIYNGLGADLIVRFGKPIEVWKQLTDEFETAAVYTNKDYEPYALARDESISNLFGEKSIAFKSFKDQVIFERNEILKNDNKPYTVFTPYSRKWKQKLGESTIDNFDTSLFYKSLNPRTPESIIKLEEMGFKATGEAYPERSVDDLVLKNYEKNRDIPGINGTSRLSLHLRFGIISIRELVKRGVANSENWLNELIWREFYMMILFHFPHVVERSFKPKYDNITWINDEAQFELWTKGKTGFPLVDAGMRELNSTGFMHNRIRMLTASFLCKHLLIDWRWGEAYFAEKLLDFELSSNNGGWQWASGSGCDAAPYFRIFNPHLQLQKFDPKLNYVNRWVPEYQDPFNYNKPIVDHKKARMRALEVYKSSLA